MNIPSKSSSRVALVRRPAAVTLGQYGGASKKTIAAAKFEDEQHGLSPATSPAARVEMLKTMSGGMGGSCGEN